MIQDKVVPDRHVFTYFIRLYCSKLNLAEAMVWYEKMKEYGISPSKKLIATLLKSLSLSSDSHLEFIQQLHSEAQELGLLDVSETNFLASAYIKADPKLSLLKLYKELYLDKGLHPNAKTFRTFSDSQNTNGKEKVLMEIKNALVDVSDGKPLSL